MSVQNSLLRIGVYEKFIIKYTENYNVP